MWVRICRPTSAIHVPVTTVGRRRTSCKIRVKNEAWMPSRGNVSRSIATRAGSNRSYPRPIISQTSAGVTAGIDLALALVQEDFGHRLAMQVAQQLVVFLKRPGGQAQFSAPLAAQMAAAGRDEDGRLLALQAWIAEHLAADLRVEQLAERARMSPRTFARLFTTKTGTTPAKAVEAMRLEAARRALEETTVPIKRIALDCGFRDEERMRRAFVRCLGVSPLDYRARFSASPRSFAQTTVCTQGRGQCGRSGRCSR